MKPPFIINEDDSDILIYDSAQEVGIYLDPADWLVNPPTDVKIVVYDSEGYILNLSIGFTEFEHKFLCWKWKKRYRGAIVSKKHPEEKHENELRETLIAYLIRKKGGIKYNLQKNSNIELINKVVRGEYY